MIYLFIIITEKPVIGTDLACLVLGMNLEPQMNKSCESLPWPLENFDLICIGFFKNREYITDEGFCEISF